MKTRKRDCLPDHEALFKDRDGDGIPDAVDLQVHLSPSCGTPLVLSEVLNLSACLGFETMAMDLPLVGFDGRRDPAVRNHLTLGLDGEIEPARRRGGPKEFFVGGADCVELAAHIRRYAHFLLTADAEPSGGSPEEKPPLPDTVWKGFDLLRPYSTRGFLRPSRETLLPYLLPYRIVLFSDLDPSAAAAAANLACRLGLETPSLAMPLAVPLAERPAKGQGAVYVGRRQDLPRLGCISFRDPFRSAWEAGVFVLPSRKACPDLLICGEGEALAGVLARLARLPMGPKDAEDPLFRGIGRFLQRLQEPPVPVGKGLKEEGTVKLVRDVDVPDERAEVLDLLSREVRKRGPLTGPVVVEVFLCRPEKARKAFEKEIRGVLREQGVWPGGTDVLVLNAYKPGLSWIREVVLPDLKDRGVDRAEIAFREFGEEGLEEPLRWLQEIFPADEVLAKGLSLPKERIALAKDQALDQDYRVRAWAKGRQVYENDFSPGWLEQRYIELFPDLGRVHPSSGWVSLSVGGKEILNRWLPSPIERIWTAFQREILPLVAKEAERGVSKRGFSPGLPLFEELRFDVFYDYPAERLGIGEERVSPLESLHESLYFATLDFFARWGAQKKLGEASPGRVLPVIHPTPGEKGLRMRFTLSRAGRQRGTAGRRKAAALSLEGIVFKSARTGILFSAGDDRFTVWGGRFLKVPRRKASRSAGTVTIPSDRPLGYEETVDLLKTLDGMPGFQVVEEGRSSGGLRIFSVEGTWPCRSGLVSQAKRIVFKPTLFVNCRHHANEVSSTTAALDLARRLASDARSRSLLKKTSIVINPLENVDGAVILDEMLRHTPTDKLHAGRYNRAGREYYADYFNPETPFGEARVKPALWERWLPDLCVDDHGFPSHEWEEPFAGYARFNFREFWIPRALVYLYLPRMEEGPGTPVAEGLEALKRQVSRALGRDRAVTALNKAFRNRYVRYRQRWSGQGDVLEGGIQFLPVAERLRKMNYAYLHPGITAADLITEVADETAWGIYLGACVDAHREIDLALLKLLNYSAVRAKKRSLAGEGGVLFFWHRDRPIRLKAPPKS